MASRNISVRKEINIHSNPIDTQQVLSRTSESEKEEVPAQILDYSAPKTITPFQIALTLSIFTLLSMIIGVLIVRLTEPEKSHICYSFFNRTIRHSITYDSQPSALAIADFNQDNHLDVVVTNGGKDAIGLFFGDGTGNISYHTAYPTGSYSHPYSVAVADFNQDNFIDIAVANFGTLCIGIFLGQTNGTFQNQTTFSTDNSRPIFITSADFNNDTRQDIIVVNYGTNSISIYLGNGDGTFTTEIIYYTGYDSISYSLAVADFNNDNKLDFVVADFGTNDILIYLGYGNGSFIDPTRYTTTLGSHPHSVAIADIDNDHQLDIVIANQGMQNYGIFYGYGNGSFESQMIYSVGIQSGPDYVTTGDLNKDNQTDVIIIDKTNSKMHILPGNGNRTFFNLTTFIGPDQALPYAAAVGDFNNDKVPDIAAISFGESNLVIFIGYTYQYSVTQSRFSIGRNSNPTSVALADFNNDRFLDIVVSEFATDSISVLLGYGNGSFQRELYFTLPSGSAPQCICTADLNKDNRADVVVANYGSHTVGILFGDGNGSFSSMITYPTGYQAFPIFVTVADFNNDSALDIVAANFRLDNVAVLLGYGNGSFSNAVTYSTGSGSDPSAIAVGDFNNDSRLDLAVANSENSNVGILLGNGDGSFQSVITYSTGFFSHPDSIVVGDLNNDHYLDIVVADSTADYIAILLGYANATFGQAVTYIDASFSNPSGLALGDVNYDNIPDIVVTNFGTDNVAVLNGYGNGSFYLTRLYSLLSGSGPKGVILADFNNNGRWDIVVAASGISSVYLLVRYFEAQFRNLIIYSTGIGGHPYSVVVADFNHDNRTDVATAYSKNDSIGVLLGHGDGSFASQITYPVALYSSPEIIDVGDFNQDTHTDIVASSSKTDSVIVLFGNGNGSFTNVTTYSTKDGSQPYWIVTDDLNKDGRQDFVIANHGRDTIGILLNYDYNTFKPQQAYSNAYSSRPTSVTVRDLNNDTFLDIAVALGGNDGIGILYGYGNGTFSNFTMYQMGYHSYPCEIVTVDLNNDNILDLIVANAGSSTLGVLIGYEKKTFAPLLTFSTGNNSKPYSAAVGDFNRDNKMDVVVANYHGNSIGILLGYGNGSFVTVVLYSTEDGSRPQSVAVGDFNQDNRIDVVVANYRRDNVGLFLGNGDGTFQPQIKFSTGYVSMPAFIITNDFDNDGKMDVAVTNKNNNNIGILYGYGNGSFASVRTYETGSGTSPQCLRSGNFNNDEHMDIGVVSPGTNSMMILYGLGDRKFLLGPSFTTGTKSGPISLGIGDFNNDGKQDITTANYLMNTVGVHISSGTQIFGGVSTFPTGSGSQPYSVAVSDFNNDGQTDVVVANYGTDDIGVLLGNGDGTFSNILPWSLGDNSGMSVVAAGEFNQDNQSDIVAVDSALDTVYVLLGNGLGNFSVGSNISTGYLSGPFGVSVGDLNNDRKLDLIIAAVDLSSIVIVYGYGNGTFGNEKIYTMGYGYQPYGVAVGDFDGDGFLDTAVANYGGDYVEILIQTCDYR